jgi:hypothetical protein
MEIIPINHQYSDIKKIPIIHLARIRELTIHQEDINEIYLISFNQEGDESVIEMLQGSLELIIDVKPKIFHLSLSFPKIIQEIASLRHTLELKYVNWRIYFNTTPLQHHFHAILLRDGLTSDEYEFFPYEIFDYRHENFSYVIIPNFLHLDLVDWEIMQRFIEAQNEPLSIKNILNVLEAPAWKDTLSTADQKLRKKLNFLVERELLKVKLGPNGEKFYSIKYFQLGEVE